MSKKRLGLKITKLFAFLEFEPTKCFQLPTPQGLGRVGQALMRYMLFFDVLVALMTLWYSPRGVGLGML